MATWKKVLTSGTVLSSELATEGTAGHVLTTNGSGALSYTAKTVNSNTNQLTTFVLEDGDGTEVTISQGKEIKFVDGGLIDINWSDTSTGSDTDPYDLTFAVNDDLSQYDNSTSGFITSYTNTVDMGDGFIVSADTVAVATTIIESETLTFACGTGISTSIGTDGTVTITNDSPDQNHNSWRGIDSVPADSSVNSIMSNWVFDNVKTAVPVSALFTDTNTNTLTTFTLTADSGTAQSLAHTNTISLFGGTNINTVVGATDKVSINLDTSISLTTLTCSDINVTNLTITGTSTTIETETIALHDNMIVLNSNASGIPTNIDAGIEIERGTAENSRLYYDEVLVGSTDYWGMWKLDRASHGGTWASGSHNHAEDAFLGTVSYSTADPLDGDACFYGQIHVETDTNEIWICTEPLTDDSAGGG